MEQIFRFKQFNVDQSGCAMKINTDGVLLGALANADDPATILDIGTGTGVIALMLAQRFERAQIDAVEIDQVAAETAKRNFENSPFAERLELHPTGFEQFFEANPADKYDLIVSNPPFYINSLKSPEAGRQLAKHADGDFFENLVKDVSSYLNQNGVLCLILPEDTTALVSSIAVGFELYLKHIVSVCSYPDSKAHRLILYYGFEKINVSNSNVVIYEAQGKYSEEYINLLKPYFIAF